MIPLSFRQALNEALNRQFGLNYLFGTSSDDKEKSRLLELNCRTMKTETLSEVPIIRYCRIVRNKSKWPVSATFVGAVYAKGDSAFAESRICR